MASSHLHSVPSRAQEMPTLPGLGKFQKSFHKLQRVTRLPIFSLPQEETQACLRPISWAPVVFTSGQVAGLQS